MNSDLILIVDDDPDIRTVLKDNLEMDGYRVFTASTGKEALHTFETRGASLILLDLSLPDIDGIGICRSIRETSAVPIIMLTARDRVPDKVLGLETGADDYLIKPFAYPELAARIRACLRRHSRIVETTEILELGGIRIDPNQRAVFKRGEKVDFTQTEFTLLLFLAKNAGKALSRDTIREAVWPEGEIHRGSRAIDVHIGRLRSKLEEDPAAPILVLTVQGFGYMFALTDE